MSKNWSSSFSPEVIASWAARSKSINGPQLATEIKKNLLSVGVYRELVKTARHTSIASKPHVFVEKAKVAAVRKSANPRKLGTKFMGRTAETG